MRRKLNLILSDRTGPKVKSFIFSHGFVRLCCGILMGCALLIAYGTYDYITMKWAMPDALTLLDEVDDLQSEIDTRERQIAVFQSKIDNLQLKLIRLNQLDQKIRTGINSNINVDDSTASWQSTGMGGALTQTPGAFEMNGDDYQVLIDNLVDRMEQLDDAVMQRSEEFLLLWGAIKEIKQIRESTPSISPLQGGAVSSEFGYRKSPFTGKREFHSGVDIAHNSGAPVYATAAGTVIYAGYQGVFGKTITIDHGFGIITRYAHLSSVTVDVDQQVMQGEVIGKVGSTGRSTGPHLHYEVRVNDIPVDASRFIPEQLASNNPS
jgi:murein DD-endopeptidase MepM/ murein hydrolase activator NlpD